MKKNNKQAPLMKPKYSVDMEKSRVSQATVASESDVSPATYFPKEEPTAKTALFSKSKRFSKAKNTHGDIPLYPK